MVIDRISLDIMEAMLIHEIKSKECEDTEYPITLENQESFTQLFIIQPQSLFSNLQFADLFLSWSRKNTQSTIFTSNHIIQNTHISPSLYLSIFLLFYYFIINLFIINLFIIHLFIYYLFIYL